jgi:hypothetical protein
VIATDETFPSLNDPWPDEYNPSHAHREPCPRRRFVDAESQRVIPRPPLTDINWPVTK